MFHSMYICRYISGSWFSVQMFCKKRILLSHVWIFNLGLCCWFWYNSHVALCRKRLTMTMAEHLIQLGETMMISMSISGKFLISLPIGLISFSLSLTVLIFQVASLLWAWLAMADEFIFFPETYTEKKGLQWPLIVVILYSYLLLLLWWDEHQMKKNYSIGISDLLSPWWKFFKRL